MNSKMVILTLVLVSISLFGVTLQQDLEIEETERIVGGKQAEEGKYPWTVALYNEGTYICTASIISKTAVLTAAHCVVFNGVTQSARNFYGIAGTTNRSSSDGVFIEFKNVTVHPWYNEMANDVAIFETTAPIEFSKKVQKICIANEKIGSLVLKRVVAMGWGQTTRGNSSSVPEMLQFTNQRVVSNLKCFILFFGNPVPSSALCASGVGSGICSGDSGGPLVYYAGKQPIQVGIASYINGIAGCGRLLGPAGFTRVSSFTEYIKKEATGDVCVE